MAHTRELELLVLLAILRLGDDAYGITILEELERQTSRTRDVPLARLGRARAAAMAGDLATSRTAYQDFLTCAGRRGRASRYGT